MDMVHPLDDAGGVVNIGENRVTIAACIEVEDLWRGATAAQMHGCPAKDEVGPGPPAAQGDPAGQAVDHALDKGRREQQPAVRRQAAAGTQNEVCRLVGRVGEAGIGQNGKGGIMDQVELVFAKQRQTATDRGEHSSWRSIRLGAASSALAGVWRAVGHAGWSSDNVNSFSIAACHACDKPFVSLGFVAKQHQQRNHRRPDPQQHGRRRQHAPEADFPQHYPGRGQIGIGHHLGARQAQRRILQQEEG